MKGYVSVEIPTKPYIKSYLLSQLGEKPVLKNGNEPIGNKLHDLLEHSTNEYGYREISSLYVDKVKIYIPGHWFRQRGANLNATNVRNFNRFIELLIKSRFYQMMDENMEIIDNIKENINDVRTRLGIDFESWSYDAMQKDYYRYRKEKNKKVLNK